MFALCVESSHKRGMGHLFRAIVLYKCIENEAVVLVNDDSIAQRILEREKIPHIVVDFRDTASDWESCLIKRYKIDIWIYDRFESEYISCKNIKKNQVLLISIDDRGAGAALSDIHFAGMMSFGPEKLYGKKVVTDTKYIILNPQIKIFRRIREKCGRLLVTLGGSDTYGVTLQVVRALKEIQINMDLLVGPSFRHMNELEELLSETDTVMQNVPSLIETFWRYDWAITGGGVTCLEACASGLPCIIIANEEHEIYTGMYLEQLGCAVFAGYFENLDKFNWQQQLDIKKMSENGLKLFSADGAENMICLIKNFRNGERYEGGYCSNSSA